MNLPRKARFFWVYPLAIWLFWTAETSEASLRLGAIIGLLGEALRLWANGYVGHRKVNATDKGRNQPKIGHLITAGPYAYVRHPLYVGTFLIGLGFCIAVKNMWVAVSGLLLLSFIYRRKIQEEEAVIHEEWGQEFEAYRRAVHPWFPTFRRPPQRYGEWSWQGITASKELKTVVWVTVGFLALYFREEWWQEHELFAPSKWTKHVALLVLAIALMASDLLFELFRLLRPKTRPMPKVAA